MDASMSLEKDFRNLAKRTGKYWVWLIYRIFLRLLCVAEFKKDEKLNSDLYVMF